MKNPTIQPALARAALLTLALAGVTVALPAHFERSEERSLDFALHVGATRLVAVNDGDKPLMLVLEGRHDSRRAIVVAPAHGSIDARFAPGVLNGLDLVIVARGEHGLTRSNEFELDSLRDRAHSCVWFDLGGAQTSAWISAGDEFEGVDARGRSTGEKIEPPASSALIHVPVITPHDGQPGETPPRIDERPLPPV